ncbi:MAG: hypothetical protein ABI193_12730 [Minicystis sp.]
MGLEEAAGGFRAVFSALGARGPSVDGLAWLLGAITIAHRPKLPEIVLDETRDG